MPSRSGPRRSSGGRDLIEARERRRAGGDATASRADLSEDPGGPGGDEGRCRGGNLPYGTDEEPEDLIQPVATSWRPR
jgi:hypothetical protein